MESCFAFSISLFFFLNFLGVYSRSQSAPTYRSYHCNDTTLFAPNSIYQSNLDSLLSSLSSAANNTDGFANATAGQNPPDQIYGLFLCRGDLGSDMCNDCMATAKQNILELCPNQRVSIIWYEQCMLRYSNQSIFSVKEIEPSYIEYNDGSVSATRLPQFLAETLNDTIPRAPSDRSKKIIEAKQANYTRSQKFYTLAQCTPDLTMLDCHVCLEHAISDLIRGSQGGMVLTPSCTVRCEFYLFYDATVFLGPAPPPPMTGPEGTFMPPPPPPLPPPMTGPEGNSNKSTMTAITIILTVGGVMVLFFLTCCLLRRKKTDEVIQGYSSANELTTIECLQFDLATIQAATNDFSPENKLGEGGFGEVFQGRLPDGQQIAVKRLSQSSRQGNEEFKNEVLLVAKLQHRNLVQLLGFCLEGDEKLLAYEFVPNKSLDYFLFDPQKSGQLNWLLRYKIIYGIARGMFYLHEDSRLRIIHRDLKCSNILLDSEMNPKISDFGMARIFGVDQTQASTNKIVGTFGYMSPEYAMHGEFSVKSDVYSFGILLIEIICGKKNNFYHQLDGGEYLTSYVWNQWRDGMPLKVLDPVIGDSYSRDEVLRCLHISLLCIQEDPTIRPTMATIVLMLNNNYFNPPSPRHPAFFIRSRSRRPSISMKELESDQSTNGMSITELYPR